MAPARSHHGSRQRTVIYGLLTLLLLIVGGVVWLGLKNPPVPTVGIERVLPASVFFPAK